MSELILDAVRNKEGGFVRTRDLATQFAHPLSDIQKCCNTLTKSGLLVFNPVKSAMAGVPDQRNDPESWQDDAPAGADEPHEPAYEELRTLEFPHPYAQVMPFSPLVYGENEARAYSRRCADVMLDCLFSSGIPGEMVAVAHEAHTKIEDVIFETMMQGRQKQL